MPTPRTSTGAERCGAWGRLAALSVAAALIACGDRRAPQAEVLPPAGDPREAALALFQAAQTGRTTAAEIAALVGEDLPADHQSALADALAPLRASSRARILDHEAMAEDRSAVDVEVSLPGGGAARYAVQVERGADGRWIVTTIDGPGTAWPPRRAPKDEGISTSSPPAREAPLDP
jgi:hypothetical protein